MHVFVTGGTGTVGAPVVAELLAHGHTVTALARTDASAEALTRAGADVVRGGLDDLEVLREGAEAADGVVNLAFDHSAMGSAEAFGAAIAQESAAVATLGGALLGSDRPIVTTSGTPWIPGRASTEEDPLDLEGPVAGRARTVTALLGLATQGVRAMAVRLPRTVHRDGEGGFAGILTDHARRVGVATYPGDGTQRWPAVHALDAAVLFRLALESAPGGTSWHAVGEEGVVVREIAEVIGARLGLGVESADEASFGALGAIFGLDQPAASARTREALGWQPHHPGLLADLEHLQPLSN